MATISEYFGCSRPVIIENPTEDSHAIGIEIELEHVLNSPKLDYLWLREIDGSLKIGGKEFKLATWHNNALDALTELFTKVKARATSRCGVHIHVDVTEYTYEEVKIATLVYMIFEKLLYTYSGKRWNSNYCVPIQTYHLLDVPIVTIRPGDFEFILPKYAGLHFVGQFGTLEFRQMVGTTNPRYINNWINIVVNLVKYAKNKKLDDIINKINRMRTISSYYELFTEVFESYSGYLETSSFKEDVETGVTLAKVNLHNDPQITQQLLNLVKPKKGRPAKKPAPQLEPQINWNEAVFREIINGEAEERQPNEGEF